MKLQLLTAVAATALMAIPSLAQAGENEGWYVRGNVGYGVITDTDLVTDLAGNVEGEGNVAGSLGLGYDFGSNWRLELDVAQLWNDMGAIGQNGNTLSNVRLTSGMLNAIYDFGDMGNWEPYVGAGIGLVRGSLHAVAHSSANPVPPNTPFANPACSAYDNCTFQDADTGTAWQLLAGVGYDITDNLSWDTQYRYLNASGLDFVGEGKSLQAPGYSNFGSASEILTEAQGLGSHTVMTGLRYRFGDSTPKAAPMTYTCWNGDSVADMATCPVEPPKVVYTTCWDGSQVEQGTACPAVPEVACWDGSTARDTASCPTRPTVTCWDGTLAYDQASCPVQQMSLCANEYRQDIIYYDFNKPQSSETRQKLENIRDTSESCAVSSIHVVGHTDTSGSAAYNLQLSKKRANDVRSELVRMGVDSALITSEGKGETEPFIDTGDNKKEPLNRRTEVLIRLHSTDTIN